MNQDQAKRIASDLIAQSRLDPCVFDSIDRLPKESADVKAPIGHEWVVRFAFELPDDVACSTEMAIVIVDDATGEACLFDSL